MSLTCHFPFAGLFGRVAGRCGFLRCVTRPSSQALWRANGILAAPFLLTGYNHLWLPCTLGTLVNHHRDYVIPSRGPILSILQPPEQHLHSQLWLSILYMSLLGSVSILFSPSSWLLLVLQLPCCLSVAETHIGKSLVWEPLVLFCHSASLICSPFYCRIILLT